MVGTAPTPDDEPGIFTPDVAGVEALSRELGQDTRLISDAPLDDAPLDGRRGRPALWGSLVIAGAVAIGLAAVAYAMLGGKP